MLNTLDLKVESDVLKRIDLSGSEGGEVTKDLQICVKKNVITYYLLLILIGRNM
jgi:hypothetical protein